MSANLNPGPNKGSIMADRTRTLKSYDQSWASGGTIWKYDITYDNPSNNMSIDPGSYIPEEHWQWTSGICGGLDQYGNPIYRKCYLADTKFFKNKCQEMGEDVEECLKWYKDRYAFLPKRFATYFSKALEKEYNKAKERIAKSSKLTKKAVWTESVIKTEDYELD